MILSTEIDAECRHAPVHPHHHITVPASATEMRMSSNSEIYRHFKSERPINQQPG